MPSINRLHSLSFVAICSALLVSSTILLGSAKAQENTVKSANDIKISVPDTSGNVGDQITVPVKTGDITGEDVIAYQFDVNYNGSVLDFTGYETDGTITPQGGVTANTDDSNSMRIVFSTSGSLTGGGTLLKLQADVVGEGSSRIEIENFRYEDNAVQVVPTSVSSGAFTTTASESEVDSNGRVDFSGTGVGIDFSGVSGSGSVRVAKYDLPPSGTDGISESTVSSYRFVITAASSLTIGSGTEVAFDVGSLDGVSTAENVTIYTRSTPGTGSFSAVATSFDSGANELVGTVDSFSEFVMASNTEPLPVEIAVFKAERQGQDVQLRWQTASETNNAGFAVLRTVQSDAWTEIGFVQGEGTTSSSSSYRFTDDDIPYEVKTVRYRLKQVDTDGTTHVGPTLRVDLGLPEQVTLKTPYPNPASGVFTVRYAVPDSRDITVGVYDVLGRHVQTLDTGTREGRFERRIDTANWPSGVYIIQLSTANSVHTERLTVVR